MTSRCCASRSIFSSRKVQRRRPEGFCRMSGGGGGRVVAYWMREIVG